MDCRNCRREDGASRLLSGNDKMAAANRENAPLAAADEAMIAAARKAKVKCE